MSPNLDALTMAEYGRRLSPLLDASSGYARSILHHHADAEDAVQQAAVRGLERLSSYDPQRPFKCWWYAILKRCCTDFLRQRHRPLNMDEINVADTSQSNQTAWRELVEVLDTLPKAQREILRLRYFGGLAYREIADVLAIPAGTVMSRLYYARKALAMAMEVIPK